MPVPTKELIPEVFGSISSQIIDIVSDGQGYYSDELLEKIKCHQKTLYRELGKLKRQGLILSKTMPEQSEKLGKPKNSKVYFKQPDSKDLR